MRRRVWDPIQVRRKGVFREHQVPQQRGAYQKVVAGAGRAVAGMRDEASLARAVVQRAQTDE